MSFADIASMVKNYLQEKRTRIQMYYMQYSRLSDETLLRRMKTGSYEQRAACAQLLKERGYGRSDD